MAKILVIDDERSVRNTLKDVLEYEGHEVDIAQDAREGITKNKAENFDFVVCDNKYTQLGDTDLIKTIKKDKPDTEVLVTSKECDKEKIESCKKRGAMDFLTKPINLNSLLNSIKKGMDKRVSSDTIEPEPKQPEAAAPTAEPAKKRNIRFAGNKIEEIQGNSPQIQQVRKLIDKVAPSEAWVLILGENGTGKELVAHWLHKKSNRSKAPFVEVNCAAIPSELIESELFGHEKGAFASAIKQRKGKFEQADRGTLFLDEIGDMSLAAQAKVLRVLQEGRISRVGSDKDIEVNVRVFAATNKNLWEEIEKKNFREDLYHRLSVIVIRVPALSDRPEDISMLVNSFPKQLCEEYGIKQKKIDKKALDELCKMQ